VKDIKRRDSEILHSESRQISSLLNRIRNVSYPSVFITVNNKRRGLLMNIRIMLGEMADQFRSKIDKTYNFTVQFHMKESEESYYISIGDKAVQVCEGLHPCPELHLYTTSETLEDIYHGKMTAFTAAGKARISDPAPLDWEIGEKGKTNPHIQAMLYFFVMHFFNTGDPEMIELEEEHARVVHGGHSIPLYYHPGFRSAWYAIRKGEQLNEPGDTNPFPQAFIIIQGTGWAKIGQKTIPVEPSHSYYIPPTTDHVLWTDYDEPLTLIWLAWGEGA
jgi:mannose-6-phosphate isomerase-like protein (cupin superfamily)